MANRYSPKKKKETNPNSDLDEDHKKNPSVNTVETKTTTPTGFVTKSDLHLSPSFC